MPKLGSVGSRYVWCRLRTGYVTRLVLEEGLRQQCRQPLHSLPAPALLDLMEAHAAGILMHKLQYQLCSLTCIYHIVSD